MEFIMAALTDGEAVFWGAAVGTLIYLLYFGIDVEVVWK